MEAETSQVKLLVTGASGLLGTKVCEIALRGNHEVYSAHCQHFPLYGTPAEFDILDTEAEARIFDKIKPEAVVHAAALTDVDKCECEKELAWKTNLARLCKKHRVFLIYISTDYVFDGEKGTYKEADNPAPINYYGFTKLKGEEAVKAMGECCIVRGSVIYGSKPSTGKTNFALWLLNKLERKNAVEIVTDQWNSPTLNVNMAEMILEVLEKKTYGIFHLAGATRLSRFDFANHVAESFNLDPQYIKPVRSEQIKWIAKRPKDSSLNVDKAKRILETKPMEIRRSLRIMKKEMA
jgi:dTDP-4-dehydrorhamnose reductase